MSNHYLAPFATIEIAEKYYHDEGFIVGFAFCRQCETEFFWAMVDAAPAELICEECCVPVTDIFQKLFPDQPQPVSHPKIKTMNTPTASPAPAAPVTKVPVEEYKKHEKKIFKLKADTDAVKINPSLAEHRFRVLETMADFDFGAHYGGKKHAYRVHRFLPNSNIYTPSCEKFLKDHEPVSDEEAKALEAK